MIIGHQKQWKILKRAADVGRPPHAFLFCGDEKLGKKKVAFEFISLLFGTDVEKRIHPDFIFLEPTNKEIQISQIRELNWKLSFKNVSAPLKAVIIDQAHSMNEEAQGCLLKTLEEPKGKAILILITSHPKVLFPTIISRCQTIKFYPVSDSEIENYLISKGIKKDDAEEIVQFSLGRPGLALDFLSDPQKIEKYRAIISDLLKIFNTELSFRFQYIKNISERAKSVDPVGSEVSNGTDGTNGLNEILETWLGYLRKILLSKIQGKEDEEFRNFSILKLKIFIESLQKTIFLTTSTNINQRLALENLMLEL